MLVEMVMRTTRKEVSRKVRRFVVFFTFQPRSFGISRRTLQFSSSYGLLSEFGDWFNRNNVQHYLALPKHLNYFMSSLAPAWFRRAILGSDADSITPPVVHTESKPPFDPTALGLKEIGNLASWTVSSSKPGCGVEALRDDDTSLFWQ
jgi:hypothetical protein